MIITWDRRDPEVAKACERIERDLSTWEKRIDEVERSLTGRLQGSACTANLLENTTEEREYTSALTMHIETHLAAMETCESHMEEAHRHLASLEDKGELVAKVIAGVSACEGPLSEIEAYIKGIENGSAITAVSKGLTMTAPVAAIPVIDEEKEALKREKQELKQQLAFQEEGLKHEKEALKCELASQKEALKRELASQALIHSQLEQKLLEAESAEQRLNISVAELQRKLEAQSTPQVTTNGGELQLLQSKVEQLGELVQEQKALILSEQLRCKILTEERDTLLNKDESERTMVEILRKGKDDLQFEYQEILKQNQQLQQERAAQDNVINLQREQIEELKSSLRTSPGEFIAGVRQATLTETPPLSPHSAQRSSASLTTSPATATSPTNPAIEFPILASQPVLGASVVSQPASSAIQARLPGMGFSANAPSTTALLYTPAPSAGVSQASPVKGSSAALNRSASQTTPVKYLLTPKAVDGKPSRSTSASRTTYAQAQQGARAAFPSSSGNAQFAAYRYVSAPRPTVARRRIGI